MSGLHQLLVKYHFKRYIHFLAELYVVAAAIVTSKSKHNSHPKLNHLAKNMFNIQQRGLNNLASSAMIDYFQLKF